MPSSGMVVVSLWLSLSSSMTCSWKSTSHHGISILFMIFFLFFIAVWLYYISDLACCALHSCLVMTVLTCSTWLVVLSLCVVMNVAFSHRPSSLYIVMTDFIMRRSVLFCFKSPLLCSLTLIDSSLPVEAEPELRTYISRRLSKGALLGGMGNIATVELSIPEQAVGCYCCLLEQEMSPEQPDSDGNGYVICFMGGSEKGLNLFRLELDKYVQGLHSSLQTPELHNLETEVRPYLSRWYEESVMHIHRVVLLVQTNISFLLHAALSHTPVEVINSDERTKADVSRFIKAASLQGLSQQDTTAASLCKAMSEDVHTDFIIDCATSPPTMSNTVSNRFCDDWIQAFLNATERCNPFLLRQILENFKLKAIQDMNSLKRFVRQAELSHYALFRCCQFLQSCGNGDVLLQNARAEHSDSTEACSIISVLEEFIREQAQA